MSFFTAFLSLTSFYLLLRPFVHLETLFWTFLRYFILFRPCSSISAFVHFSHIDFYTLFNLSILFFVYSFLFFRSISLLIFANICFFPFILSAKMKSFTSFKDKCNFIINLPVALVINFSLLFY